MDESIPCSLRLQRLKELGARGRSRTRMGSHPWRLAVLTPPKHIKPGHKMAPKPAATGKALLAPAELGCSGIIGARTGLYAALCCRCCDCWGLSWCWFCCRQAVPLVEVDSRAGTVGKACAEVGDLPTCGDGWAGACALEGAEGVDAEV